MRNQSHSHLSGHRKAAVLPLVALLGIGLSGTLTACGGSSGGSGGSGSNSAGGLSTIKVGILSPSANASPIYIAQDQGMFKKAGLDVEITSFTGGGASSSAALASGAVNVAMGGPGSFIGSIAKKAIHGKVIAQLMGQHSDLVAAKGISSVSDLKGKTIGVSGINSSDDVFIEALLQKEGLSKKDYTIITAGNPTNRYAALSSGKIQATIEPDTQRVTSNKTGTVLVKAEDSPVRMPGQVFYASDSFLSGNVVALKKFVKAMTEAATWARKPANLAAATKSCMKGSGSTEAVCEGVIKFMYKPAAAANGDWTTTFDLNKKGMESAIQTTGVLIPEAKGLKYSDIVSSAIVSSS